VSDHHDEPAEPARARTLEDVARLAGVSRGVSRNTVSLAIRGSPRVNAGTRERVMQIVHETGYRPNFAARALAGRRTTTVGLIRYGSSRMQVDSYYDPIMAGLRQALDDGHYDLLFLAPSRIDGSRDLTEPVASGRVDGLVVLGTQTDREAVAEARRRGVHVVHVGRRDFGADVPYVSADEIGGTEEALNHLAMHGHTRIALVSENLGFEPARDKAEAYRRLRRAAGASPDSVLTLGIGQADPEVVRSAVRELLDRQITAAVTTRDPVAIALMRGLRDAGVQLPESFAVIGFDNLDWAPWAEPPLSCIGPPRFAMGRAAGEMIVDLIEGRPVRWPRVLPTQLVTRRSCGCPWTVLDERPDEAT
jgi:LacI family transcriptional regulator